MFAFRGAALAVLALLAPSSVAVATHQGSDSPAEAKVRSLIERADGPCKLDPPLSTGVSEYASNVPGINEVSATFDRKGPNGASDQVVTAHWEIRDDKVKPLDPMAGEVMRKCDDDPVKPESAFDWRSLPYFGGYSQAYLDLVTSKRWGNVEQLNKHLSSGTGAQEWEEVGGYIWRRDCDPGKDSIKLSRTVYLPGRPWAGADISAGINTANGIFPPNVRPVTEAEVTINGEQILKIHKNGLASDFGEAPAKIFRHGANKVVIEADKRKTGKCNTKDPSSWVGVDFFLKATYASDLEVDVPEDATAPALTGIPVPFKVIANGPSGIPEAVFAFTFTVHTSGASGLARINGAACEPEQFYFLEPPTFGTSFVCRVRNIERGDSKDFDVTITPDLREGRKSWSASLTWSSRISGMGEIDGSNQNGTRNINACRDTDNNGICDD